jgi:hypothetical protein
MSLVRTGNAEGNANGNMTNTGNTVLGIQGQDGSIGVNFTSQGAANGTQMITVTNYGAGAVDYLNGTLDRKNFIVQKDRNRK